MNGASTTNAIVVPSRGVSLIQERAYCGQCERTLTIVYEVGTEDIRCNRCYSLVMLGASGDD